jgi:hypothetical protein
VAHEQLQRLGLTVTATDVIRVCQEEVFLPTKQEIHRIGWQNAAGKADAIRSRLGATRHLATQELIERAVKDAEASSIIPRALFVQNLDRCKTNVFVR